MDFNTNWDVESHRSSHESEEHWNLKKKFMESHKDEYPEEKLVCLAQVFANVEFMGCRYPVETMGLVKELSAGSSRSVTVVSKPITFVLQDSNEPQEKIVKRNVSEISQNRPHQNSVRSVNVVYGPSVINSVNISANIPVNTSKYNNRGQKVTPSSANTNVQQAASNVNGDNVSNLNVNPGLQRIIDNLILIEESFHEEQPDGIFQRSLAAAGMKMSYEYGVDNKDHSCIFKIDNFPVCTKTAVSKKLAREQASKSTLAILRTQCVTLYIKQKVITCREVERPDNMPKPFLPILLEPEPEVQSAAVEVYNTPITNSNVGNKMLRMMGWDGGGLGKSEQGIKEPVRMGITINRFGLGLKALIDPHEAQSAKNTSKETQLQPRITEEFRSAATRVMMDYKDNSLRVTDLTFVSDFTKEERCALHLIASKLGFKTKSYGKEPDRFLVVSKKSNYKDIVSQLMRTGGENEKYKLVLPRNKAGPHNMGYRQ